VRIEVFFYSGRATVGGRDSGSSRGFIRSILRRTRYGRVALVLFFRASAQRGYITSWRLTSVPALSGTVARGCREGSSKMAVLLDEQCIAVSSSVWIYISLYSSYLG
jgi:hypothetical protein